MIPEYGCCGVKCFCYLPADDAGGVFAAWDALRIIKSLGITPRRTIRVVGWTNEENGAKGASQYAIDHANELASTSLAFESDSGTVGGGGGCVWAMCHAAVSFLPWAWA